MQDIPAPSLVWDADGHLAVQAAWPPQRRIKGRRAVGGSDHHKPPARLDAVQQREQLRHHPRLVCRAVPALRTQHVNLVDEQHARASLCQPSRPRKHPPQVRLCGWLETKRSVRLQACSWGWHVTGPLNPYLALADKGGKDVATLESHQVGATAARRLLHQQRLARPWWPVQQHPLGALQPELLKEFPVQQRIALEEREVMSRSGAMSRRASEGVLLCTSVGGALGPT